MKKDPVFWMGITAAVMAAAMICCNLLLMPEVSAPMVEYAVSRSVSSEELSHGKIDINSATAYDLEQVEGIGPAVSGKILSYIAANGPVTDMEQLLEVEGIGAVKLERLKYYFFAEKA